jgi:hypothetical protein
MVRAAPERRLYRDRQGGRGEHGSLRSRSKLQAPCSKLGKAAPRCRAVRRRPSLGAWSLELGAHFSVARAIRSRPASFTASITLTMRS